MPAATGVCVVNSATTPDDLDGGVEGDAFGHQLADALEPEEAGVALVGVEHVGIDAERPQRPYPADAEHDLLAEAMVLVAAVQAVGHGHAVGGVAGHLRVEQVQRDAPDVGPPDVGGHRIAGQVDCHLHAGVGEAERARIELSPVLLLPSVRVEPLAEVALRVEQADADQRHAEVR